MKLFSALAFLALSASAFAAPVPLVVKTNAAGFVPPEFRRSEVCAVYADGVVITRTFGTATVVERRSVTVSEEIKALIIAANKAEVETKDNTLCDGPSTSIVANVISSEDHVLLYSTGGCGSPRKTRAGAAAGMLMEIVNEYCPKTFKVGE